MNPLALNGTPPRDDTVPGVLAPEERRRIGIRLGAGLTGIGLLGLGTLLVRLAPDQWQIGEFFRGLAAAVVGIPTLISGLRGVVTGDTRRATDQLVAIAVLAAAATGDFVTATLIPLFLEVGRLFEERSSLGARAAIDGIRALGARQAVRWRNGVKERVDPNTLKPGDEILVRPGERIAVDGTVLEGRAAVDQSAITGESLHHDVGPGSPVFAGTVALDGLLRIQVRGAGADTVLGRVVQLLAEVERTSVPVLRLFERRAGVWLPLVLTLAASTLFFTGNLSRAITVLVVAAPTALVVAGPASVVAAMTVATPTSACSSKAPISSSGPLRRRYLDPRQDRHRHCGRACRHRNPAGAGPNRSDAPGCRGFVRLRLPASGFTRRRSRSSVARHCGRASPGISRSARGSAWSRWLTAGRLSSGAGHCSSTSASVPSRKTTVTSPKYGLPTVAGASRPGAARSAPQRGAGCPCRYAGAGYRPPGPAHRRSRSGGS